MVSSGVPKAAPSFNKCAGRTPRTHWAGVLMALVCYRNRTWVVRGSHARVAVGTHTGAFQCPDRTESGDETLPLSTAVVTMSIEIVQHGNSPSSVFRVPMGPPLHGWGKSTIWSVWFTSVPMSVDPTRPNVPIWITFCYSSSPRPLGRQRLPPPPGAKPKPFGGKVKFFNTQHAGAIHRKTVYRLQIGIPGCHFSQTWTWLHCHWIPA